MKIAVREAKNNLSKYGDLAHAGERIIVSKNGKPWFDLVPHKKGRRNVKPLAGVKPTLNENTAVAPVSKKDIEGWI
jgi:prevent-host-death family protein